MNLKCIFTALALCASVAAGARSVESLDFDWEFCRQDTAGAVWEAVSLPHDFLISQPWVTPGPDELPDLDNPMANVRSRLSARAFKEPTTGWYRKWFTPDSSLRGQRLLIDVGGIMLTGDLWVNGRHVGKTDYGYLGFESDVTDLLNFDRPNEIVVKAETGKPDNSRWYTGGGLYRDVRLVATDPQLYFGRHPLRVETTPMADGRWQIALGAEIAARNRPDSLLVGVRILSPDGKEVYSATRRLRNNRRQKLREFEVDTLALDRPQLWDCEHPNLYTLEMTLLRPDGTVSDSVATRFGVRSVEFGPDFGFRLNGRKVLLKGIANHHTLGALGAAAYPRAIEKRLRLLKEYGFNHVRTSHNPYSEDFLNMCDSLGLLVVDELYDKWSPKFAGGRVDWMQLWPNDIPEWVKRDRNHPSVVMWSLGNELQMMSDLPFNDWGVTAYNLQKTLLHRYDKKRPVTVAMHPRGRGEFTDSVPAPLALATDIASYNYRYLYFPGDSRRFTWLTFYQSEANTSAMGPNFFGMDLDKVVGLAYWGMIDYLGESNGWPAKGWTNGVFDISLRPKPIAYFLKSFFMPDEPEVRIGVIESGENTEWNGVNVGTEKLTSHWNRKPGSVVSLWTFTNADSVELRLNGRSLGQRINDTSDPAHRNRILWDSIPYSPGILEAIAYKGGREVKRHAVSTTGALKRLTATADNPGWKADGMDLCHIDVSGIDSKGRIVPSASLPLTFSVEGDAEIAGVINGDMTSEELTTGNTRRLFMGEASVILRAGRTPGPVTLTVSAPGMKPVRLKLATK